mmetsp:Transcript_36674/g.47378  ORF Transcript_36674/g.47378 Transcript_36674/m.47378 type:complete len:316 (+) Transcript_36674:187-1134(+)
MVSRMIMKKNKKYKENKNKKKNGFKILEVSMDSDYATTVTIKSLLIYLYTDTLECPPHRIDILRKLALDFKLDRLVSLCLSNLGYRNTSTLASNPSISLCGHSTFEEDLKLSVNEKKFADVLFYNSRKKTKNELKEQNQLHKNNNEENINNDDDENNIIWAHRCLLSHVEYFNTLLNGKYKESIVFPNSTSTSTSPFLKPYVKIDLGEMIEEEGLNFQTLKRLIQFVYTGSNSVIPNDDPNAITELAAAAERFGVISLVKVCERSLVALVNDTENATACVEFANRFNLRRLGRHCNDIINNNNQSTNTGKNSVSN